MNIKLPIEYTVKIECKHCLGIIDTKILIQDMELVNSYERDMGTECQYDFTGEVTCSHCKHNFEVDGQVWEYPEGDISSILLVQNNL